ncbi:MAG: hypothetical protein ABR526_13190 [Chthoniobacterales bacterium]
MSLFLIAVVLLLPYAFVILLPFSIVQRYRSGTARRMGRPWVASLNVFGLSLSAFIFLIAASFANFWAPNALLYSFGGLVCGILLGFVGLRLTRWEPTARGLHYTPPRILVLLITLVVTVRLLYGFWRAWHAWHQAGAAGSWLAHAGAAGSLAIGAGVLGYYFTYWCGVARKLRSRGRLHVIRVR